MEKERDCRYTRTRVCERQNKWLGGLRQRACVYVRACERERERERRKSEMQERTPLFSTSCLSKATRKNVCKHLKPRIFILKFCNLQQENKMEDILQKILKEASSEKFAHISVKAHKANGETTSNRFQQQR